MFILNPALWHLNEVADQAHASMVSHRVRDWVKFIHKQLHGPPVFCLREIANHGNLMTGVRCMGLELLADAEDEQNGQRYRTEVCSLADFLHLAVCELNDEFQPGSLHEAFGKVPKRTRHLVSFTVGHPQLSEELTGACEDAGYCEYEQLDPVQVTLRLDCLALRDASAPPIIELSPRQAAARDLLVDVFSAKIRGLSAGQIRPAFHALFVGPSGSGKTRTIRAAAAQLGFGVYEVSLGSWLIQGSRGSVPTLDSLTKFVEANSHGVLFIDECDKLRPGNLSAEYTRYLIDEVMSVLDGRLARFPHWDAGKAEKFASSFPCVLAGAWQEIYVRHFPVHQALGGTWDNLEIGDAILDSGALPEEVIFRLSTVVELAAPPRDEIRAQLVGIYREMGIVRDRDQIDATAREIAESRQGYRGIEAAMIAAYLEKCRADRAAGKETPKPPKPEPPEPPAPIQDDFPF